MKNALCLSLFLIGLTHALLTPPGPSRHVIKERIHPPSLWSNIGVPSPGHILHLRVALPQTDYVALEAQLNQISHPQSPHYGQLLTKTQVEYLIRPPPESVAAAERWLTSHGIDIDHALQRSPAGDWLNFRVPVSLAEQMLSTKYHTWQHADGTRIIRTTQYSLPSYLSPHVELVQPTTSFARAARFRNVDPRNDQLVHGRRDKHSNTTIDPSCKTRITISCLQEIYNLAGYVTESHNGNKIGVTGFLEQFANKADLQLFLSAQRPDALNSSFEEVFINGGADSQNVSLASPEADLDIQFALGLIYPAPVVFYSTGGLAPFQPDANEPESTNEPYLEWVEYLLSHADIPQTISTSYGDDEQTVPKSYAIRVCQSFAQLGARGVSLLFGSGDSGVAGSNPDTQICVTNDGKNTTRFISNFPASCPFVTAVGATQSFDPEVATTRFASGGGFSDYFARPAYAEAAVTEFFRRFPKDTYAGLYNVNGAPIPDVSAQGDHYQIIWQGKQVGIGGASAATPTFASIVSMLNDARIGVGKTPLGWLNPLLYAVGKDGLNDIITGSNPGCGTPGFNATRGWDPVTGLGTPNFAKLKEIVLKLP